MKKIQIDQLVPKHFKRDADVKYDTKKEKK